MRPRSGFHIHIDGGRGDVAVITKAKPYKLRIVRKFATALAAAYPDLHTDFVLFGREKAPLDGGYQHWYACARYRDQHYRLFVDFISQARGKMASFAMLGSRCHCQSNWTQRRPRAVFRGSNTGMRVRPRLCELSIAHPDMLDARMVPTRNGATLEGVPLELCGGRYKVEDFAGYRYQLNTDSWGGLYWKLLSGSVVIELLDADVPWVTWRHQKLRPYEHYVPATVETVLDQIEWCRENDEECRKIAARGRKLAREELGYEGALRFAYEAVRT